MSFVDKSGLGKGNIDKKINARCAVGTSMIEMLVIWTVSISDDRDADAMQLCESRQIVIQPTPLMHSYSNPAAASAQDVCSSPKQDYPPVVGQPTSLQHSTFLK